LAIASKRVGTESVGPANDKEIKRT